MGLASPPNPRLHPRPRPRPLTNPSAQSLQVAADLACGGGVYAEDVGGGGTVEEDVDVDNEAPHLDRLHHLACRDRSLFHHEFSLLACWTKMAPDRKCAHYLPPRRPCVAGAFGEPYAV